MRSVWRIDGVIVLLAGFGRGHRAIWKWDELRWPGNRLRHNLSDKIARFANRLMPADVISLHVSVLVDSMFHRQQARNETFLADVMYGVFAATDLRGNLF